MTELEEKMLKEIFVKTGGRPENPEIANICANLSFEHFKKELFEAFSFYAFKSIGNQPYNEEELMNAFKNWFNTKFKNYARSNDNGL